MKSHFSRGGNYFSTKLEGNCSPVNFFFKGKCQNAKGKTLKRFQFFIFVHTLFLCVYAERLGCFSGWGLSCSPCIYNH